MPRRSAAVASATNGTIGCGSTPRLSIAERPTSTRSIAQYTASKSELVGLVNAYLDLGTWWCFTPFIGAGAGVAKIKIDHFRDVNVIAAGGGWADTGTQTNFAWALHAGAAYKVNPNFAVELSYRYLNVGNAQSGTLLNLDPT